MGVMFEMRINISDGKLTCRTCVMEKWYIQFCIRWNLRKIISSCFWWIEPRTVKLEALKFAFIKLMEAIKELAVWSKFFVKEFLRSVHKKKIVQTCQNFENREALDGFWIYFEIMEQLTIFIGFYKLKHIAKSEVVDLRKIKGIFFGIHNFVFLNM